MSDNIDNAVRDRRHCGPFRPRRSRPAPFAFSFDVKVDQRIEATRRHVLSQLEVGRRREKGPRIPAFIAAVAEVVPFRGKPRTRHVRRV
jgi:hypothetical protein